MHRGPVVAVLTVSLVLVLAGTGSSKKPKPQPCPGGRYIVTGSPLVTGDSSGSIEPVVIGAQISIGNACNPVHANLKATKHGTTVKAVWPSCAGLKGKVKLNGTLDATCTNLSGKLTAKKSKLKTTFVASKTRCGDGILDPGDGEECDGADGCTGGTCGSDCKCVAATTPTTTTTSTTLVGRCLSKGTCDNDPAKNCFFNTECDASGTQQCALNAPTAKQCTGNAQCSVGLGTLDQRGCCGDGINDGTAFGETCDLGPQNCATDTLPCASGCTSNCRKVGSCTGSSADCLNNADCAGAGTCCGNGDQEPPETCDDGNTKDGDSCPSNCVVQSCTVDTGTHQGISLQLTTPAGVTVGGLTLFLDFPEGNVRMPVTTAGTNVLDTPKDLTYGLNDALIDASLFAGIPANGAGPMLQVMFDGCQGQPLPSAATDYKCTITDASDEVGTTIDPSTLGCAVTIP
jgi:cysteine-rich repeat protein